MANDQKDDVSGPVRCDPTPKTHRCAPTPRHPLFGALKGYAQVIPGTDLTQPADPEWGDDEIREM
jgi:hypothetical protein